MWEIMKILQCRLSFTPLHRLSFHNFPVYCKKSLLEKFDKPSENWLNYNKVIYPPQKEGELPRPAEIFHERRNIKYSKDKLWYQAIIIRGMSIDEAIKQLTFLPYYGAKVIREVLLEAQNLAVKQQNVEFKSNLWVAESFTSKGVTIKGIRRHAKGKISLVKYGYCHYFVRLIEGQPPAKYYPTPKIGFEQIKEYIEKGRERMIEYGL